MCLVSCAKTMNPPTSTESVLAAELSRTNNKQKKLLLDQDALKILEAEVRPNGPDFLAVGTQWTRTAFQHIEKIKKSAQRSTFAKILTRTSQPIYAVAVFGTLVAMYWFHPAASPVTSSVPPPPSISWGASADGAVVDEAAAAEAMTELVRSPTTNKFALFGYLSTFGIQMGAQIWMTFVSGLALYFSLPRHTFGQCQKVLFPKYFLMNACLGLIKLISFCHILGEKQHIGMDAFVQIVLMCTSTLIEATIYLYFVEPLLNLMHLKHQYELMVGSGREVGFENQKQLKASPAYQKVHKSFRRTHMIIAMGNLATVAFTFSHLYYMIQKIEMS